MYFIAPGGSILSVTPDGSLGTNKPPSHLSVPEGRSFFKDNKDNKNNMIDSMLSKLSALFFLRQPLFCFKDNSPFFCFKDKKDKKNNENYDL